MQDYDLMIIGGGPAGYTAGIRASMLGLKTAVIEKDALGGTCLNRGCIPTKALLHAAGEYKKASEYSSLGLKLGDVGYDLDQIYARVEEIVRLQVQGIEALFKAKNVSLIRGTGRLEGPGRVSADGQIYKTKYVLLASGSAPQRLPIPGSDLPGVYTSDDLLREPAVKIDSLTIIGGGVIGCELASFYADLGIEVTILEARERLLPLLDADLGKQLQTLFKRRKITVRTEAAVTAVTRDDEGLLHTSYRYKNKDKEAVSSAVLLSTGRVPVTEGLWAEDLRPEMEGRFVKVDEHFQTSIPGVYAAGDLIGGHMLAHEAEAEGQEIASLLAGRGSRCNTKLVPSAVYTDPEIASVGPTEEALSEAGIPFKVGRAETLGNARCMIEQSGRGFVKILAEAESGRLLAVHMIMPRASDLITAFIPCIVRGGSYKELLSGMRPHPSFSEVITEALEAVSGEALHSLK